MRTLAGSGNVRTRPRWTILWGGRLVIGRPSKTIEPRSVPRNPLMQLKQVVLSAPVRANQTGDASRLDRERSVVDGANFPRTASPGPRPPRSRPLGRPSCGRSTMLAGSRACGDCLRAGDLADRCEHVGRVRPRRAPRPPTHLLSNIELALDDVLHVELDLFDFFVTGGSLSSVSHRGARVMSSTLMRTEQVLYGSARSQGPRISGARRSPDR